MSAPTKTVREVVYRRDSKRCVSCGALAPLEFNHRQGVGMGGSKHKPNPAEGITSCRYCNTEYEGSMSSDALHFGWKVRRFCPVPVWNVPVFYRKENAWFLLNRDGSRDRLIQSEADELRLLAGILPSVERVMK